MFWPQSSPLLQTQSVEISADGEHVVWRIGNAPIRMHYVDALYVSDCMRGAAAEIKTLEGQGKTARTLGMLHNATPKRKRRKRTKLPFVAPAVHCRKSSHDAREFRVVPNGKLVEIRIGDNTINLPAEGALRISQWLRVRAKEARNTAGDSRHWSKIHKEN